MIVRIKSLIYIFTAAVLFTACSDNQEQTETDNTTVDQSVGKTVALTPLSSGYFLKNDVALGEGASYMVATKETSLTNNFGYGAVMGESHEHPDFDKELVLAIAVNIKGKTAEPSFTGAKLVDNDLRVFCEVKILDEQATYESTPIALSSIKRNSKIKTISFYDGNTLARRVELSD